MLEQKRGAQRRLLVADSNPNPNPNPTPKVEGDVIEAGCFMGGTAVFMRAGE